jgi:hypothetical protein
MSSHNDSFAASGTSPTNDSASSPQPACDFIYENHGSIFLLRPISPASFVWIEEHLPPARLTFGNAIVVEPRYIWAILAGLQDDGLTVSR